MVKHLLSQLRNRDGTVNLAGLKQLLMRAGRFQPAVVQHQNLVGAADGADALGNDKNNAVAVARRKRLLNFCLRGGVHGAGGVVQNQNFRLFDKGAGNGQPLLLAAGKILGALLHFRRSPS